MPVCVKRSKTSWISTEKNPAPWLSLRSRRTLFARVTISPTAVCSVTSAKASSEAASTMASNLKHEGMAVHESVCQCGRQARDEVTALCEERGVEENIFGGWAKDGQDEAYLAICREVWAKYHTTNNFKVGDKVYVKPSEPDCGLFPNCIRATVTETGDPRWGYHLRAFQQDLPVIYMFNMWDKDLIPRTNKANKPVKEI